MTSTNAITDIPSQLQHWADTVPEREVFVFFDKDGTRTDVLTARDVYVLAGRFASRLRDAGFLEGDLITNAIPNSAERVVTDFGIIMAGCIGSNCQIMEKDGSDFLKISNRCKTTGIILPALQHNSDYAVLQQFLPPNLPSSGCVDVAVTEIPSLKHVVFVDRSPNNTDEKTHSSFLDSLRHGSEEIFRSRGDISPDSIVFVFGTSGTTGYSKMSPRAHTTILSTARSYENRGPSVRINQRPLGWLGGYPFSYLANSTSNVIQDCFDGKEELTAKRLWEVVEREGCTSGFMLPQEMEPFLAHFKDDPPKYKLNALVTGGQPLTTRVCDVLGVLTDGLVLAYACTEMSSVTNSFITSPDQMEDFMTGLPMPGVKVKVVDEDMQQVDTGKEGMILINSPYGSNYYYNQTPEKPTCTDDGYFISGDRGWVNKDGVLFVSGRSDDVVFHGSILVYPSWPESALIKIPEVSEAVVVSVTGPQSKGVRDQLCACITLRSGSSLTKDDIVSSYNESFVTRDMYFPKLTYVELFNEFPKGFSGKVNKNKLREMAMSRILS